MKRIIISSLIIISSFFASNAFCNQRQDENDQAFFRTTSLNKKIQIENNQLKLIDNRLNVELYEDYFWPIERLWQKEEGTYVTLSADPEYQYQCMSCGAIYEYQPIECTICEETHFIPRRREK